jgi:DHA1 family bicyclomycin/chloramphenicol resistance-like MFS transporter
MIPALSDIGRSLHVAQENDQQLVVIAYFLGFASTQLLWGPLADRFGRKPILAVGVGLYGVFALLCALAGSFPLLIAGRVAMGASAAVTRVLVVAMVRDLFEAEAMARVMSLVFMTFMLVPVLAPNIGQLILLFAPWRAIFVVIAVYAATMLTWSWMRLPETLHPEFRRSLDWRETLGAIGETLREPQSRGYTLAMTVSFSALVAYISSIQQIIFDSFRAGEFIGLVFASIAAPMALASWLNSRVVGRYGLRRVGHSAALAFMLVTAAHATIALAGFETLPVFIVLQALTMACFAFTSSNMGTLAMEHMAHIAGTASSVQGVIGTVGAALIGFVIGQQFNGSPVPFVLGTALCAAGGFLLIILTEPKRLFAPMQADREEQEAARESTAVPEDLA